MNPILENKIQELKNASDYECWYLVKHSANFVSSCYLVSILKEYKINNDGLNIENYVKQKVETLNSKKENLDISTNYRALRVAAYFGLIIMTSSKYEDALITETYEEVFKRCNGEFEKVELYTDVIQRQIEKMFLSSDIDEAKNGVRQNYRLYPVMLLYKILIELGRTTGEYSVSINEYRYLLATTKKFEEFLETLLLIKLYRLETEADTKFDEFRSKFDNRLIQALKQLPTLSIDRNKIVLKEESVFEVAEKVYIFENNSNLFNTTDYLSFLGSTKSLFSLNETIDKLQDAYDDLNNLIFNTDLNIEFELNRIVFGAPGTGKSHRLQKDSVKLLGEDGVLERVTFHPDYSYANFVGTYKPISETIAKEDRTQSNEITYKFVPGPFMRVLVAALKNAKTDNALPHLLLIEEINRAKVAAVFGDVFQLLDRDNSGVSEYKIHASEDIRKYLAEELKIDIDKCKEIAIPNNMFIWATMNSADQGVFPMDTAFKRRWNFEYIGIDEEDKDVYGLIDIAGKEIEWNQLRKAINKKLANEYSVNEDKLIGPYFLSKKTIETEEVTTTDGQVKKIIKNTDLFTKAFKSKVLMYLYEDAAKQHKKKMFPGCSKYSDVCNAFDQHGIKIFGDDFETLYEEQEV